ncbi:MAG: 2-phospho-L-lactate transferase CofD family protein [Candidatus Gracilibacteria bacterium]
MIKITTIGGGNGQSNLLDGFLNTFGDRVEVSSIVSMSDDGRTTGKLMRSFDDELGLHLPPPGDLRRCLYSLSLSKYKTNFVKLFETILDFDGKIKDYSIFDILKLLGEKEDFIEYLKQYDNIFLEYKLPLESKIEGHKFGNILMATLYYNLGKNYDKMIKFMHDLLEVKGNVIPVTTKRAYIRAILGNGNIIESQDRISNVANYNSGIADLELMNCSYDAVHNKKVHDAIINSDFLIIGPGDLFTSIISNFIIGGVKKSIQDSKAKIIYIGNTTNKGGETTGLTQLDFVNKIERFLGRRIDYFISNNKKPELTQEQILEFKNDISVKGGDYLFLSKGEKDELIRRKINTIETNLISGTSFYKHSKYKLLNTLEKIIF